MVLASLISTRGEGFRVLSDEHLTFHLGDDRSWMTPHFDDYWHHNKACALRILAELEAAGRPLSRFARLARQHISDKTGLCWSEPG